MSHWTTIKTQVKDLVALEKAAQSMGFQAQRNGITRGYANNTTKADLVVKLPGPYDAGFVKQADGTYGVVADYWRGHVENALGPKCSRLMQEYSYQVVKAQALKRGMTVTRQNLADGTVKLMVRG